ncbi:hypothetical protein J6TS2_25550 [Heyndrickxia sporothermodurans]|nr:hypothetical protein J6TS2_25550 [Heyndrickxia sporothermodurans]
MLDHQENLKASHEPDAITGMEIDTIIGDTAYSDKDNIQFPNLKDIKLVSKLHPIITQGPRKQEDEFAFNKDAGMYVCKAGHMATSKARTGKKNTKTVRAIHITLILRSVKYVLLAKGVIKRGLKVKHILLQ